MLDIVLTGLNHITAPVALRERLAFTSEEVAIAIDALKKHPAVNEIMLFSTCNRVEVLMTAENGDNAIAAAKEYISEVKQTPLNDFEDSLYVYHGRDAVRHIFRVASSLDSMVVGEPQILGQIKDTFKTTVEKKASGVILNRLFHRTFNVAKRVRSETGIGDSAVSISYAAIELGKKIFGSLENRNVLLVGAGEMAELAVEHLIRNRVGKILVANRTFERGVELAQRFRGEAVRFDEIGSALETVDIIISSTGSPSFVITHDTVKSVIKSRRNRSLFFIDIAVPRDIDPQINTISNAYVYDIDDLTGVIDENVETRNKEAVKAERIVDEAVILFEKWVEGLHVVPTIVDLKDKMHEMAIGETKKTLSTSLKHLSKNDSQAVMRMTEALVNKILHDPIQFLKNSGTHRDESVYLSLARTLFNLDKE
jgi:glutamyl-tRNA reductase